MTLDELVTQRDNLQKNINSGYVEVRFGERWLKFQNTPDMQRALADVNNQIAAYNSPSGSRSMCTLAKFNG